ncbi:MAG: CTP synthase, partial [Candidatus Bathyarchaeia archaeon]
ILDEQGMGDYICSRLKLEARKPDWSRWKSIVDSMLNAKYKVRVALCGKYTSLADSYVSILEALKHAGGVLSTKVEIDLIEAEIFEDEPEKLSMLDSYDGIIVPPGFGRRGTEGKIAVANYAREMDIPFLGLCFGFQMAIVAFARYVCKLDGANSTENDPNTSHPVIDLMLEQRNVERMGGSMRLGAYPIRIKPGTLLYNLYSQNIVYERHRHRWEVNPEYWGILESHGMVFSGVSLDGDRIEAFEIPSLKFYVGTQYHPEFKSRPGKPSPIFYGFVKSCLSKAMETRIETVKL